MQQGIIFNSWAGIGRTLFVGALAYVALVALLRVSGKRTLSKMNAFDLIVTVALGSTLASVLLTKEVALAEGIAAFALLIGLQFLITWTSTQSEGFQALVKAEPTLLLHCGELLPGAMRQQRVAEEEVQAAVRAAGLRGMGDVEAVVLETDGSFSVIPRGLGTPATALTNVERPPG